MIAVSTRPLMESLRCDSARGGEQPGGNIEVLMDAPSPDHPRHKLASYVAQDVDFEIRDSVVTFVVEIGASRAWDARSAGVF